jgi:uncharacterized protein YktA (UPF0223 family)
MAINLYDFHDIIRETYNEYVSRYEIDLVDFKNEYGTDSEPKFIEYQRIYLSKMRDYIIENLSKIDNEDLDSQFYHDKLQEALSDNKKMFHFLNVRLNPMNYTPEPKENASKDEYLEFFENLNNNKITESGMIKFIKSHESILELETLIRDIDAFDKNYYAENLVYNLNKRDLSESFTTFKELVLSKIDELKNDTSSSIENKLAEYGFKMAEAALFHIFEFTSYDKHSIIDKNKAKEIAIDYGFTSPTSGQKFQEHYNKLVFPNNRTNLNEFSNKKSLTDRISYYNNIVEKLSDENKIHAQKELEILNNLYQHHKFH